MDREKKKKIEAVIIDGLTLVKRHPVGWQTQDGRYELLEIRRGLWEAYDGLDKTNRKHVASGGTRAGLVQRLKCIIEGTYKGALPYVTG
jgi:hypothetical protein